MWHLKLISKNRQFMAAVKMCSTLPLTLHGSIWGWTFTRIEGYLPVWRGVLEFQRRQTKKTQPSGKTANLSTNKTPQQNLANENHFHHKFKSKSPRKTRTAKQRFFILMGLGWNLWLQIIIVTLPKPNSSQAGETETFKRKLIWINRS